MEDVMFRKGFASFLIAAAATAVLSGSASAQVRTAALQTSGFQLAQAAQAENRVALVIGNSAYQANKPLNNPVNDAQAVSQMLNQAGFEVVMAFDLTRDIMKQTVEEFAARILEKGDNTVAMVYYAGHGIQADGENYLIPIDAKFQAEDDLAEQGVKLADVVAALEAAKTKARIVVVDACRNNPFGGAANDENGGLALVDAPEGALIAYSTAPGTVAYDGLGKHSPYAAAFMRTARTPNLPVEQVFKKVRLLVNESTDKKQTPWDSARLTTEFFFFANAEQPAVPAVVPATVAVADLGSRPARQAYEIAIAEDKEEYYEEFVRVYAADPLADHIRRLLNRRKQMVAWQNVTHRNRPEDYADFARRFRDSDLSRAARRLQERPRVVNISFPRRGEGRFGDGRFGIKVNVGNNGRPVINLPGRGNGNNAGRPVIGFPQNAGNNNNRPVLGQNNGGRPVINQNGQNNGGRPVINQNVQNAGNRVINQQNGQNNNQNGRVAGLPQNGNNANGNRVQNGNNNNNNGNRVVPVQNGNNGINGRLQNNQGNVNQNRPVIQQQPQVLRNQQIQRQQVQQPQVLRQQVQQPQIQRQQIQRAPQIQQRAPQIQRQVFQAPRQTFQAPRQSFQAPRQSFQAPRQSFQRSFSGGGGGGFGGGRRR
jgi:uncharacterized caspase-like protein